MKKEKLSLSSLQVNSFVVGIEPRSKTIVGGFSVQGQGLDTQNHPCSSPQVNCSTEPCFDEYTQ